MRPRSPLPSALPDAWVRVLDEVDATLRKEAAAARQREQTMSPFALSGIAEQERGTRWQQAWERLQERMEGWPRILQRAEQEVSDLDLVLKAGEEALHRWLSEAEALGQSLAKWARPEV